MNNIWVLLVMVQHKHGLLQGAQIARVAMEELWATTSFTNNDPRKVLEWKQLFVVANIFLIGLSFPRTMDTFTGGIIQRDLKNRFVHNHLLVQFAEVFAACKLRSTLFKQMLKETLV